MLYARMESRPSSRTKRSCAFAVPHSVGTFFAAAATSKESRCTTARQQFVVNNALVQPVNRPAPMQCSTSTVSGVRGFSLKGSRSMNMFIVCVSSPPRNRTSSSRTKPFAPSDKSTIYPFGARYVSRGFSETVFRPAVNKSIVWSCINFCHFKLETVHQFRVIFRRTKEAL